MSDLIEAVEALESVLCDPEGTVCIHGSDADRAVIQHALASIRKHASKQEVVDEVVGKLEELDFEGDMTIVTFAVPHGTSWTAGEYCIRPNIRPSPKQIDAPQVSGALAKIDKALEMVHWLCQPEGTEGARRWVMSIPARPDHDPDLVIASALYAAKAALSTLPEKPAAGASAPITGLAAYTLGFKQGVKWSCGDDTSDDLDYIAKYWWEQSGEATLQEQSHDL